MTDSLELEAVDRAAELLARYHRDTHTWDIKQEGSFWDAVALLPAWRAARELPSPEIAVVDCAFDMTIPALAGHEVVGDVDGEDTTHGSIVALLVLSVLPDARLVLYPASRGGKLDPAIAAASVGAAAARGVAVINLSMGLKGPQEEWFDEAGFLKSLDIDENGRNFAILTGFADTEFRQWLTVPPTPLGDAVAGLEPDGPVVVAAAGNAKRHLSTPAVLTQALAAGFISEARVVDDAGAETASAGEPSYAQSGFTDVAVVQPPDVLGSSFATPLVSGLVAGACTPDEIDGFRECVRLGALASQLWLETKDDGTEWTPTRQGRVDALFLRSVQSCPHQHQLEAGRTEPCPACAFFAAPTYIDYGMFKLQWSDFAGAEVLLLTARVFAPRNPHACANLAATYLAMADVAGDGAPDPDRRRELLLRARFLISEAITIRPDHIQYRDLLTTVEAGLAD